VNALDLVGLAPLINCTSGRPGVKIGLIDGPVAIDHPDLAGQRIREISGNIGSACTLANSAACLHGTFVAGILSAKRGSSAPAICPECTLLVRPIFAEAGPETRRMPSATPGELAMAITESIGAGAQVINLSAALVRPYAKGENELKHALDHASRSGVIIVAAAGNQGVVGGSIITCHPWVIPVVAYDLRGRPMAQSNLGSSIGKRGIGAPGENVTSLGATGDLQTLGGTSTAAPFVTGAIALLWSNFVDATATEVKFAILHAHIKRRGTIVAPLLDAWRSYVFLATARRGRMS